VALEWVYDSTVSRFITGVKQLIEQFPCFFLGERCTIHHVVGDAGTAGIWPNIFLERESRPRLQAVVRLGHKMDRELHVARVTQPSKPQRLSCCGGNYAHEDVAFRYALLSSFSAGQQLPLRHGERDLCTISPVYIHTR
jgi:hypothetical protein